MIQHPVVPVQQPGQTGGSGPSNSRANSDSGHAPGRAPGRQEEGIVNPFDSPEVPCPNARLRPAEVHAILDANGELGGGGGQQCRGGPARPHRTDGRRGASVSSRGSSAPGGCDYPIGDPEIGDPAVAVAPLRWQLARRRVELDPQGLVPSDRPVGLGEALRWWSLPLCESAVPCDRPGGAFGGHIKAMPVPGAPGASASSPSRVAGAGRGANANNSNNEDIDNNVNILLVGPQGSGKSSFLLSCFQAFLGRDGLPEDLADLEVALCNTDDGTTYYDVYRLSEHIFIHDTRGAREYNRGELNSISLVVDGRATPGTNVKPAEMSNYWSRLAGLWQSDERVSKTFSRNVIRSTGACINTEPHFVFLVLDPTQQELLTEDEDFKSTYAQVLAMLWVKGLPFGVLCTHGDELTDQRFKVLEETVRTMLREARRRADGAAERHHAVAGNVAAAGAELQPLVDGDTGDGSLTGLIRTVENYTTQAASANGSQRVGLAPSRENDPKRDTQILLVLSDAVDRAIAYRTQRLRGQLVRYRALQEHSVETDESCSVL